MGGKDTSKVNPNQDYKTAPSMTVVKRIGGKEFIVTSYFAGNKDMKKVLTDIAERRAYADTFRFDDIKKGLAKEGKIC